MMVRRWSPMHSWRGPVAPGHPHQQRITLDKGVLDVAEQGEDHAGKEYEKALAADISTGLRTVVERQLVDVRSAHDQVKALRDAHA